MTEEWFYSRDGQESGPVSSQQLKQLVTDGQLLPTDLVWRNGMKEWAAASHLKGLFVSATPAAEVKILPPRPQPTGPPKNKGEAFSKLAAEGAGVAKRAFRLGSAAIKHKFGAAIRETLAEAVSSFWQLIKRPLKYGFVTVLFCVASALASVGLLTMVLLPVFTMGYITVMNRISENESPSLKEFLVFMRHGWDSLWHIVMMLAAYFVTLAAMVTPVILAGVLSYFALGSVGAVFGQLAQFAQSSEVRERPQTRNFDIPSYSHDTSRSDGPFSWLGKMITNAGEAIVQLIMAILISLLLILVQAPLVAAMILIFYLALDVVSSGTDSDRKYDLVYDAFGRMLSVAQIRWKRLLCSSIFLPLVLVTGVLCAILLGRVLVGIHLYALDAWVWMVLLPFALAAYIVYANIFVTRTCADFFSQLQEAQTEPVAAQ